MAIVYRHRNPKTLEVFYVGVGKDDDGRRSIVFSNRNVYWKNYVSKHGKPIVEIVARNITVEESFELEILLISEYGRRDLKTGTLVNLTEGGDNNCGINNGMYGKGYLISGHKHPFYKKDPPFKGMTHTNEARQKMSNSHKGKKLSEEHKIKISIANKGKVFSEESKDKLRGKNNFWYGKGKLISGGLNPNSKLVLDENNGVFYDCLKDCLPLYNYSYSYLKSMLNGNSKNKTYLKYC